MPAALLFLLHFNVMPDGLPGIYWSAIANEFICFSEHGSLSSNLIVQNDCCGGIRLLKDSGSQF